MKRNQSKTNTSKTTAKVTTKKGAPTPATKKQNKPAAAIDTIQAAPEPTSAKEKPEAREGSKNATVLAMLRREGGVSLGELAQATDWQLHSIRGFLSTMGKKMGVKIESIKGEGDPKRRYHIA